MEHDVPNFSRVKVEAAIQLAIDNNAATNSRADKDPEDIPRPVGSTVHEFPVGAHANVIFEMHTPFPFSWDRLRQLEIMPIQIRCITHLADAWIDLSRNAHPKSTNSGSFNTCLLKQFI